jgi:uncharacterized protein
MVRLINGPLVRIFMTMTTSEILRESIERLRRGDVAGYVELFHPDAVMEFPFATGASPRRLEGRDAVAAYLAGYPDLLHIEEVLRWVDHGDVVEFAVRGTVVATGEPYEMAYVAVLSVEGGLIRGYRDYWSPVAAAEALGGEVLGVTA